MKIGIDIGGSHIAVAHVENERIINEIQIEINQGIDIKNYIEENLINSINKIKEGQNLELIGIGAPGNPRDGVIKTLVNLGLEELDIKSLIERNFNVPVLLKNDGCSAALAEKEYGSIKEYEDAVFLAIGTGIGGAVFMNNKLLTPKRNTGFEMGHMIIDKNGKQCNCGKEGCFETYCSIKRFKQDIREILNLTGEITGKEYRELIEKNKDNVKINNLIDEYINNLIIGLSNITDIFEPQVICIGGGFVHYKNIFYNKLIEEFNKRKYVFNKNELPEIKLAKLGNYAGIIGAVI